MWWSKEKGLQIEDLGSRIWSTHKKFRQIDRQTNRETDISSIRHTSHCYTFTIYCLVLYNEWTDLTSFLFVWDALDNLYKLWTMTIVQNFKSFTSFQQAFLGKKKVRVIFWIKQPISAKILQPCLQVLALVAWSEKIVGVCTCKENESGGNRHSFYNDSVSKLRERP